MPGETDPNGFGVGIAALRGAVAVLRQYRAGPILRRRGHRTSFVRIREFEQRDLAGIRTCIVMLQDSERARDPRLPAGDEIADEYLAHILQRCGEWSGTIFVAEESGEIAGFVCVWSKVPNEEPDEGREEYGLVSDLAVMPGRRGRGIGRALLSRAEGHAKAAKTARLRVGLFSSNMRARALYSSAGFLPFLEYLEKDISGG